MALSQNEPNAIVCCEDSQIYGLSGLCSLPKVRLEESVVVCCQRRPDPSYVSHCTIKRIAIAIFTHTVPLILL
jgi:hypothetical protein